MDSDEEGGGEQPNAPLVPENNKENIQATQ